MAENELIAHYNKFSEDKRLTRNYGRVEYLTSMKYIHECLEKLRMQMVREAVYSETENSGHAAGIPKSSLRILDIGAGTGRYSVALAQEGYDVIAVELVKYNLGILKRKGSGVKAYQGNALKLKRIADNSVDLTLLFGPMYHLYTSEDKLRALSEAKRVTRQGGYILVAYLMNEYGVLTYGFKEKNVKTCLADGRLTEAFHCVSEPKDLYDYVRLEDMEQLNLAAGLERVKVIAADGAADYMRQTLNEMDEETFELFMKYHLLTCERMDLMGASAHTVDILKKIHI